MHVYLKRTLETELSAAFRREIQIVENSVFNTEALKRSVRRLNQLGFFEPFEESEVDVEKIETAENEVNIRLDLCPPLSIELET